MSTVPHAPATPEFMWCQRSDRVYVTIKVADCQETSVDVSSDHRLEFRGRGNGMCGQREYALSIRVARPVVKAECRWFVCGPSVRVRLEKVQHGPYWGTLIADGVKMAQCKVDWQSWLDEDEESEVSGAPNGFDIDELQMKMLSEEDEFYKDPDHMTTSESEGEEESSVMLDDGMNDLEAVQAKFDSFDEEKQVRERTKQERRQLRESTRDAVRFAGVRARDVRFGRPTRQLTAAEEELIAGAPTLRARLKEGKAAEKVHFQAQWWHQRRPDAKHTAALTQVMRDAALVQVQAAQGRQALGDKAGRNAARLAAYEAALRAAVDVVGPTPKSQLTIREMARVAATGAVGRALGLVPDSAGPEWPALNSPNRAESTPAAGEEAGEVERVAEGAAELRLEESDEDELALESNDNAGADSNEMVLESNAGRETGLLV